MVSKILIQLALMMALMVFSLHTVNAEDDTKSEPESEAEKNGVLNVQSSMAALTASVLMAALAKAIHQ